MPILIFKYTGPLAGKLMAMTSVAHLSRSQP